MHSKNFSEREMACKHCGKQGVTQKGMDMLQELRDLWGKPMIITSAYRCEDHPVEAKKAKGGQHTKGHAFDIKCTPAEMVDLICLAKKVGFTGFGMAKSFLHVDAREQNYTSGWMY